MGDEEGVEEEKETDGPVFTQPKVTSNFSAAVAPVSFVQ